jgi:hypothetical protein
MINDACEQRGLDTIYKMPSATWSSETNLILNYGSTRLTQVQPWIIQLKTGVRDPLNGGRLPVCPYDITNLRHLGEMLL